MSITKLPAVPALLLSFILSFVLSLRTSPSGHSSFVLLFSLEDLSESRAVSTPQSVSGKLAASERTTLSPGGNQSQEISFSSYSKQKL